MTRICCIGAGRVGGPAMTILALEAPDVAVTVVDRNPVRIAAWNSDTPPVFEPGLAEAVRRCRGKNLHFTTQARPAILAADIVFVAVDTPTKTSGLGAGRAADLRHVEAIGRLIAEVAETPKIVVEKSTVPVRTAETLAAILATNVRGLEHCVLSNPEFTAAGSALAELRTPVRVLIGSAATPGGLAAAATLADLYARWVPRERIVSTGLWPAELAKLAADAFLAQRISSVNTFAALCEATGAELGDVTGAMGRDPRLGAAELRPSAGFGGGSFRKTLLNLVYLCEHSQLPVAAAYWDAVLDVNEWHKERFAAQIVRTLFNTVAGKRIAVLGFAGKKDTDDTRDSPAIDVVRDLLAEKADVAIYDPQVPEAQITHDVLGTGAESPRLTVSPSAEHAAAGAHALVVVTDWDEFRTLDFARLHAGMAKPACAFDGCDVLPLAALRALGFRAFALGRPPAAP